MNWLLALIQELFDCFLVEEGTIYPLVERLTCHDEQLKEKMVGHPIWILIKYLKSSTLLVYPHDNL